MSEAPKDGSIFYIRQLSIFPCKWTPYKPSSEQVRKHGIMGRWQQMNDFGGWENVTMEGGRHVEVKFDWRPSVDDFQTMQDTITELVGALDDALDDLDTDIRWADDSQLESLIERRTKLDAALTKAKDQTNDR